MAARTGTERSLWAFSLRQLIEHLPDSVLPAVIAETWQIKEFARQLELLEVTMPRLSAGQQKEAVFKAVGIAREFGSNKKMAEVCARLAPYLPEELYLEALTVAPRTVEGIRDSYPIWPNLLPHLPPRLAPAALSAYRGLPSRFQSPIHLAQIAVKLPEAQQARLIEELFSLTRAITDVNSRARTFIDLWAYVPDQRRREIVVAAFETVQAITGSQERATVLGMLAPHLPEDLHDQALTVARRIPFENNRGRAAWQASDFSGLESRAETWVTTLQLLSERDRPLLIGALTTLAPPIVHLGGRAAVGELFLAYRDVSNWWP